MIFGYLSVQTAAQETFINFFLVNFTEAATTRAAFVFGNAGNCMGLYLTKKTVALIGGTIALESALGIGTQFMIWVPALA